LRGWPVSCEFDDQSMNCLFGDMYEVAAAISCGFACRVFSINYSKKIATSRFNLILCLCNSFGFIVCGGRGFCSLFGGSAAAGAQTCNQQQEQERISVFMHISFWRDDSSRTVFIGANAVSLVYDSCRFSGWPERDISTGSPQPGRRFVVHI
jgi:hypothetical protein